MFQPFDPRLSHNFPTWSFPEIQRIANMMLKSYNIFVARMGCSKEGDVIFYVRLLQG